MNSNKYPLYIRLSCVLIILISLGYLIILGKDLLTPLVFAILLAILLVPFANFFENILKLPRGLAAALTVVFFIAIIAIIFMVLGGQISALSNDWPSFKNQLAISFAEVQLWVSKTFHVNVNKQMSYLNSAANTLLHSGTFVIGTTLVTISSGVFTLIFVILYTILLLVYRSMLKKFLTVLFLPDNASTVVDIIQKAQKMIRKYIIGLLTEMAIVSTVVCVAFWIMGIKYALLLGLLTGFLNLIPYIGIFTALLISALITFATASGLKVLLVTITTLAMHLIDANVLLPVIVGSKVKINALITVIGVVVGEMFWGIPGMFLSIPVIAILKIVFDNVLHLNVWGILLGEEEKHIRKDKT